MKLEELQQWIEKNIFINSIPIAAKIREIYLKNNHPLIYKEIISKTSFLSSVSKISQRIWHIQNNTFNLIKCKQCGNNLHFIKYNRGYGEYCNKTCVNKMRAEKFRKDNNGKSPLQIKEIKEKAEQTCSDKYGDKNFNNRVKAEQTCLEKYGNKNFNNRKKAKQTNNIKYGSNCPQSDKNVRKKTLDTLKKKYKLDENLTKINPFQIEEVKNKIKENNKKKHGVEFTSQRHLKNIENLNEEFVKNNFFNENTFDFFGYQIYFNLSRSYAYVKLKEFGIILENISSGELDLRSFIKTLNCESINNSKALITPLEIDIYLPEYKLGIEYNGLYWHSEKNRDKNFHLNKTERCEENNIFLFHIFEHQWNDVFKREIIKSMIHNKLDKVEKIYARKCLIKKVDVELKNDFLNLNHIQGQQHSNINFGLYFNNELVALMTFGKSRFNKSYKWELLRFCNKKYTRVIGGASKLLNHFIKNYGKSILTYADRTYSNGNLYEKIGFIKKKINKPSYFYFNNMKIVSRLQAQKKKLITLLNNYNPKLTEEENMFNNGFTKVWTCGTIQYTID
jgi:hypothetical protein